MAQGGLFLEDREGRLSRLAEAYFQYWWGEVGRPWVRARFPEPLPEEAQAVAEGFPRVELDRKSTRLNSSHLKLSRMPSSA